nr:uncharacterized protein LOC110380404 isoform X2 [Helicoverpa armigera]
MSTADNDKRLLAIYKLKFYQNKNNWKLSEDVKDTPSSQTNCKLDETYSIDDENNVEVESPHNKAFLDQEPADEPDAVAPVSECPCTDQAWPSDQSDQLWQDAEQEWCGVESEGSADELAEHPHYAPWTRPAWPSDLEYDMNSGCAPLCRPLSPRAVLDSAQQWLRDLGYEPPEDTCPCPLEESIEFVRGAHHAPHSSEIDLSDNTDDMSSVCTWSGAQLRRGVMQHCAALATLLGERNQRDILYGRTPSKPPIPLDEYPTRDTDPLRPPDFILSGSHRPADTRWLSKTDTLPSDYSLPHIMSDAVPVGCRKPETAPLGCRVRDSTPLSGSLPEVMPLDCRMSDVMPVECRAKPLGCRISDAKPSDCGLPGILPAECVADLPAGRGRGRLRKPVIRIGMGRPYRL